MSSEDNSQFETVILLIAFLFVIGLVGFKIGVILTFSLLFSGIYLLYKSYSYGKRGLSTASGFLIGGLILIGVGGALWFTTDMTTELIGEHETFQGQGMTMHQTLFQGTSTSSTVCQDIYAYYFNYRCCSEETEHIAHRFLGYDTFYECPQDSVYCLVDVESTVLYCDEGRAFVMPAGTSCEHTRFLGIDGFDCHGLEKDKFYWTRQITIQPGERIYGCGGWRVGGERLKTKLCDCQLSPCGVPCPGVAGSSGCSFIDTQDIYDENGNLVQGQSYQSKILYTVPRGECYAYVSELTRHPIGNTCEECEDNYDCVSMYGDAYTYQGKQYGSVCTTTGGNRVRLQLYGCMATGTQQCIDFVDQNQNAQYDIGEVCREYGRNTRCDLYTTVELPGNCCPGDGSCGPNAFCDDYQCKSTMTCMNDNDCLTKMGVVCDFTTKTLKTPYCSLGQCDFKEQAVDCCSDANCADGYFCAGDYMCYEKPPVKTECPFGCCTNERYYFDKACPYGELCCADHTCRVDCDDVPVKCNYNQKCEPEIGENVDNCIDCQIPTLVCENCIDWFRSRIAKVFAGESITECTSKTIKCCGWVPVFKLSQGTYCPLILVVVVIIILLIYMYFKQMSFFSSFASGRYGYRPPSRVASTVSRGARYVGTGAGRVRDYAKRKIKKDDEYMELGGNYE